MDKPDSELTDAERELLGTYRANREALASGGVFTDEALDTILAPDTEGAPIETVGGQEDAPTTIHALRESPVERGQKEILAAGLTRAGVDVLAGRVNNLVASKLGLGSLAEIRPLIDDLIKKAVDAQEARNLTIESLITGHDAEIARLKKTLEQEREARRQLGISLDTKLSTLNDQFLKDGATVGGVLEQAMRLADRIAKGQDVDEEESLAASSVARNLRETHVDLSTRLETAAPLTQTGTATLARHRRPGRF